MPAPATTGRESADMAAPVRGSAADPVGVAATRGAECGAPAAVTVNIASGAGTPVKRLTLSEKATIVICSGATSCGMVTVAIKLLFRPAVAVPRRLVSPVGPGIAIQTVSPTENPVPRTVTAVPPGPLA